MKELFGAPDGHGSSNILLDFDRVNYVFTTVATGAASPSVVTRSVRFTDDIVRVGLNYRFNWGGAGVVASY